MSPFRGERCPQVVICGQRVEPLIFLEIKAGDDFAGAPLHDDAIGSPRTLTSPALHRSLSIQQVGSLLFNRWVAYYRARYRVQRVECCTIMHNPWIIPAVYANGGACQAARSVCNVDRNRNSSVVVMGGWLFCVSRRRILHSYPADLRRGLLCDPLHHRTSHRSLTSAYAGEEGGPTQHLYCLSSS